MNVKAGKISLDYHRKSAASMDSNAEERIMIVDMFIRPWDSPEQLGAKAASRIRSLQKQPWLRTNTTRQAFEEALKPVDVGVVLGLAIVDGEDGTGLSHAQVAELVAVNTAKIIGFGGINPLIDSIEDEIKQLQNLNLQGVVINPSLHCFHPCHSEAYRLYGICEKQNLPVVIDNTEIFVGSGKMAYSDPILLDEVAEDFPDLKIVIAQAGHPYVDHCLSLIGRHANVYAEVSSVASRSWDLYQLLLAAHQRNVIDKLFMGSGYPFDNPEQVVHNLFSVNTITHGTNLPMIPREMIRMIVERDIFAALDLKKPLQKTDSNVLDNQQPLKAIEASGATDTDDVIDVQVETEIENA